MSITGNKQGGNEERNWYIIYTNSGYEQAVEKNLKQRIKSMGMEDQIFNVMVPTEKVVKIRHGKKVEEDVKIYPGYVLVEMIVNDKSWWVVRNTPRVSGFLGTGIHPVAVTDKEMIDVIEKMKGSQTALSINFEVDDLVKIIDGPFKDTEGKIIEIDEVTGELKLVVLMFGRDTEVIIDMIQVKSI